MAEPSSTKLDPTAEKQAESEPTLAKTETDLATNPKSVREEHGEDIKPSDGAAATTGSSMSDMASNATATATAAATGVKDSVFAMFGGGGPKEKKAEEEDDADEPSGSSKAKKAEGEEVSAAIVR